MAQRAISRGLGLHTLNMLLPSGKTVTKHTPIYSGSNFTWGEATKDCTRYLKTLFIDNRLIIHDDEIEKNIVATAKKLDELRKDLGSRPIYVNSWYRPPHINALVGGAKWSRHQYGDAVDICSAYYSPQFLYRYLHDRHPGGLGRYFGFVHIDFRQQRARWVA